MRVSVSLLLAVLAALVGCAQRSPVVNSSPTSSYYIPQRVDKDISREPSAKTPVTIHERLDSLQNEVRALRDKLPSPP